MKKIIIISLGFILGALFIVSCGNFSKNGSSSNKDSLSKSENTKTDENNVDNYSGTWYSISGNNKPLIIKKFGDGYKVSIDSYISHGVYSDFPATEKDGKLIVSTINGETFVLFDKASGHIMYIGDEWKKN